MFTKYFSKIKVKINLYFYHIILNLRFSYVIIKEG